MNEATINSTRSCAAPARTPIEAVTVCLRKSFDFRGRASRSEFWWFYLFTWLCVAAVYWLEYALLTVFAWDNIVLRASHAVVYWGLTLPWAAAGARRIRDSNRSGWNMLWAIPALVAVHFWTPPWPLSAEEYLILSYEYGSFLTVAVTFLLHSGPAVYLLTLFLRKGRDAAFGKKRSRVFTAVVGFLRNTQKTGMRPSSI